MNCSLSSTLTDILNMDMEITMFSSLCLEVMTHLLVDFFAASHLSASVCSLWREMTQGPRPNVEVSYAHTHRHTPTSIPGKTRSICHKITAQFSLFCLNFQFIGFFLVVSEVATPPQPNRATQTITHSLRIKGGSWGRDTGWMSFSVSTPDTLCN